MPIDPKQPRIVHTTRLALWYLEGNQSKPKPRSGRWACGNRDLGLLASLNMANPIGALGAGQVHMFLKGRAIELPTCPKCAVLWDQAFALRVTPLESGPEAST